MTTDTDGYHKDMKFKRKVLFHFLRLKVIPQKTKFNIECLISGPLDCFQTILKFPESLDISALGGQSVKVLH